MPGFAKKKTGSRYCLSLRKMIASWRVSPSMSPRGILYLFAQIFATKTPRFLIIFRKFFQIPESDTFPARVSGRDNYTIQEKTAGYSLPPFLFGGFFERHCFHGFFTTPAKPMVRGDGVCWFTSTFRIPMVPEALISSRAGMISSTLWSIFPVPFQMATIFS